MSILPKRRLKESLSLQFAHSNREVVSDLRLSFMPLSPLHFFLFIDS